MASYNEKVQRQIEQYKDVGKVRTVADIQELPDIFHYWSNKYVLPLIMEVFDVCNVIELYSEYFKECLVLGAPNNCLLSVGCGDCSFETAVAQDLLEKGANDFVFECFDISPHLVQKSQERVDALGLGDHFRIFQVDINLWMPNIIYCGVMAHQSLHHVVELESLLANIRKSLHPSGVFISSDMIGRNGHMRWPETLEVVNAIWAFMPDRYKHNRIWGCFADYYHNHDCSEEGFEGIRSEDILSLLVKNFHFERFLAYGGIPEVFVERCFGHNFSPEEAKDTAFVDFLEFLNRLLIDLGHIKPTMMFAVMRLSRNQSKEIYYRHWSPSYCIRKKNNLEDQVTIFNCDKITYILNIIKKVKKMFDKCLNLN